MQTTHCTRSGPVAKGSRSARSRQRGQALIYGLFVLVGGLAALFFLFNTGQLMQEKTKLVNTSDAVAYSAGVMNARALNYTAYTNRALIANELSIAQMVSLSSWAQYLQTQGESAVQLNCRTYYSISVTLGEYFPVCVAFYYLYQFGAIDLAGNAIQKASEAIPRLSEVAKLALQTSQLAMYTALLPARHEVMNEVAQANYVGDGEVQVDDIPLQDSFLLFTRRYGGDDRERFKQATMSANALDSFTPERSWRGEGAVACIDPTPHPQYVQRAGGTTLIDYDEWRALDTASWWTYHLSHGLRPRCRRSEFWPLGYGAQAAAGDTSSGSNDDAVDARINPIATSMASSDDWHYSGLPSFFDLTPDLLSYDPGNSDPARRRPTLDFAVRVTRPTDQTRTSEARSQVPPSQRLNNYHAGPADGVYASVSASQAYFEHPGPRSDGRTELASLFNPYWQVRLIDASPYLPVALVLQGVAP